MHVNGLGRNCLLLYVLVDAGFVGRRNGFAVWQCAVV